MRRLLLFAKRPRLGKVKTRLCPPLDATQALLLYRAFLTDQCNRLRSLRDRYRVELWWDAPPTADETRGLNLAGLDQHDQGDGDLGVRLTRAFSWSARPTIVIGADSPTLGSGQIEQAFSRLSELRPLVIMPSIDGGYVLLGLWRPQPEVFADIPWSGEDVCAVTLRQATQAGLTAELLPVGYDIDDAAGLRRLEADLAFPEIAATAPATLRALRLLS